MSRSDGPEVPVPRPVIVDSNGWFLPERSGTDLRAAVENALGAPAQLVAPRAVLRELARLVTAEVPGARTALALARRVPALRGGGSGDEAVLAAARETGAWVLTADRELAGRLLRAGTGVLAPRRGGGLIVRRPKVAISGRATVISRPPVQRRTARRGV